MSSELKNLSSFDKDSMPEASKVAKQNFLIAVSEWNSEITGKLLEGALEALKDNGATKIDIVRVPGSFELVYAAKRYQEYDYDAIIILGSVVRGGTPHFDYVCSGVTQGISRLNAAPEYNVPVIFGLLTTDTYEQALDRAGGKLGNKGFEAGITAIRMANIERTKLRFGKDDK